MAPPPHTSQVVVPDADVAAATATKAKAKAAPPVDGVTETDDATNLDGDLWESVRASVVKVYVNSKPWSQRQPWQRLSAISMTGSAFVVAGRRLLTNAHVVEDEVAVFVRRRDSDVQHPATVLDVSAEADLALLAVDGDAFWAGLTPTTPGPLPALQDRVIAMGYPTGGDSMSITSGVVSRVEMCRSAFSGIALLGLQVDAAINSGNSGGPAFNAAAEVVGVAHQNRADAQNIGYIIPWGVIEHFLADVADGPSTGICGAGFSVQPLDNPHLRAYKRLPPPGAAASAATTAASAAAAAAAADQGDVGVLIRSVPPVSPAADAVRPGDVLTALDGMAVTSAATVAFPGRGAARIGFNYLVSRKQVGDPLRVSLLRDGVPTVVTYPLASVRQTPMVPATGNRSPPEYLIVGGMVFLPLTSAYLRARYGHRWHSSAPSALVSLAHTAEKAAADDQVVILSHVLAAPINRGYKWDDRHLVSLNGTPVRSLAHLGRLLDDADGPTEPPPDFWVFELGAHPPVIAALRRDEAAAALPKILATHGVPAARSVGPLPPPPPPPPSPAAAPSAPPATDAAAEANGTADDAPPAAAPAAPAAAKI